MVGLVERGIGGATDQVDVPVAGVQAVLAPRRFAPPLMRHWLHIGASDEASCLCGSLEQMGLLCR